MKFIWIIQDSSGKHYNWTELYKSVIDCGSNAVYVPLNQIKDYKLQGDFFPILIGGDDYLLLASKNKVLCKGIFNNDSFFCVNNYISIWNRSYLNWDTKFITYKELLYQRPPFFIRPIKDDKSLNGQIVNDYTIHNIQLTFFDTTDPSLCVATVKNIHREWRAIIVSSNVVSICRYAINSQTSVSIEDVPKEVLEFVMSNCKINFAPIAWVMDIAEFNDNYYVLECNIFNASNFYDCYRKNIVLAVENSLRCNDYSESYVQ